MPNFELYERGQRGGFQRRTEPTVTVQRRGSLSLSQPAWEMLGKPRAVVFLVDPDERLIGFRRSSQTTKGARRVTSPFVGTYTISAVAVCNFLKVDRSEARRYPLRVIDGTPCIDLREPGEVVTSNRRGTGAQ